MRREGFTLIELLVVIAIIAILAMLLSPVFVHVMSTAKTAKCIAHGHELSKACFMYMDQWDGRFPRPLTDEECKLLESPGPYDWSGTPNKVETYWPADMSQYRQVQLKPYVKNKDIWICPSPKGDYTKRYAYGFQCSWLPRGSDNFVDGDRGFVEPAKRPKDPERGRTIAEVQGLDLNNHETDCGPRNLPPSKKIMWMCYAFGELGNQSMVPGGYDWKQDMFPDYPHGDGSVFVYADGHAARKRMGMAWAPVGYTNLWMDQDPGR